MDELTPLEEFEYTKDWTNPADFPTYEGSEEQVRADLQFQPNEIKLYLGYVKEAVNKLIEALDDIVAEQIPDNSVSPAKLQTDAVVTEKIADGAVTTAKIALRDITEALLAQDSVTEYQIKNGEVKRAKLALKAVNTDQLEDGAITEDKLGHWAVTWDKIKQGAITGSKIDSSATYPSDVGIKHGTAAPTTTTCPRGCIYLKHS